jgi:hypothetical protein
MIKFACPSCNKPMRVDDKHVGKQGKCPKCGNAVKVPERSALIEFLCASCGHWIRVAEHCAGKQGKCPTCENPVMVPQQETAEASESPATDEDLYEESAAPRKSAGLDRRVVIIVAGVVTVLVVTVIGLVIFFWPSDSGSGAEPVVPRVPHEAAETESQPQTPAVDAQPAEQTVAPEATNASRLQFVPSPGDKRTMRVTTTTRYAMSAQEGGQAQDVTGTQSVTVDLEAMEAQADGTNAVRVTLARIEVKTEMNGITAGIYDSARVPGEDDPVAGIYAPFVGKRFTIGVSSQGEIVDSGLDELFLAAAQGRVEAEDEMMRGRLKERADAAIERTDQRFGSRQARTLDLKKQLEEFPSFGCEQILSLLDQLIAALPAQAVQSGASWNGPIAVRVGTRVEMPATYTVTALDEDACTIDAQGERGTEEEPFVYQTGPTTVTNKLAGSSQVKLVVDRQTGWLRRKEQKTRLSGHIIHSPAGPQGTESAVETTMEITTTVAPVE